MIRRFARTLLLLATVLGLLPGGGEAVEQLGELVQHGHPAHSVPGETTPAAAEHGCTTTRHQCPCHEGQSVEVRAATGPGPGSALWLTWMLDVPQSRNHRDALSYDPAPDAVIAFWASSPPTPPPSA